MVTNGIDVTSVEGAANIPYAIPNLRVELTTTRWACPCSGGAPSARPTPPMRSRPSSTKWRKRRARIRWSSASLLKDHPRHAAVLKLAAEKAVGNSAAEGRFRGVAVAESFSTLVAQVAEISLRKDGQGEGGTRGLRRRLRHGHQPRPDQGADGRRHRLRPGRDPGEEMTLTAGVVDQGNYDSYTSLRIDEMPMVEVHIVPSEAAADRRRRTGRAAHRPGARQRGLSGDEEADADATVLQGVYSIDDLFDCKAETSAASSGVNAGVENAPGLVASNAYVHGRLLQQNSAPPARSPSIPSSPGVAMLAVPEWRVAIAGADPPMERKGSGL